MNFTWICLVFTIQLLSIVSVSLETVEVLPDEYYVDFIDNANITNQTNGNQSITTPACCNHKGIASAVFANKDYLPRTSLFLNIILSANFMKHIF
jgi:hypothetical protein